MDEIEKDFKLRMSLEERRSNLKRFLQDNVEQMTESEKSEIDNQIDRIKKF